MSSNLPQLPEYALQFRPRWPGDEGGFTEAQLRAYGKACAAAERADAERYRWLRDVGDTTWRPFGLRAGYSAATADAAIDAAIRARGRHDRHSRAISASAPNKGLMMDDQVTVLPDGSAFATASWPLPKTHWLYAEGHNVPPMPLRMGTDNPERQAMNQKVWAAAKYAIRSATMNGKEPDFDPDALCQNMVVGLLGYHTADGLSSDSWDNPPQAAQGA